MTKSHEVKALDVLNFRYSVDAEADRSRCHCTSDYCKCTTLSNARVGDVNIRHVAAQIVENLGQKPSEIDQYCIERLCRAHKLYESGSWDVRIADGYYGDEIGSVLLCREIAEKLDPDIQLVLSETTLKDKILFVLVSEYGYELPVLQKATFEIVKVPMADIVFGQVDHYRKVDRDALKYYKDYDGIFGVVLADGGNFRVIDGYNRLAAAKADKKKTVKVVVANG